MGQDGAFIFLNLDAGVEVELNATAGADLSGSTDGSATASESTETCIDVLSPISFNVGATGKFLGISDTLSIPIYKKSYNIYQVSL